MQLTIEKMIYGGDGLARMGGEEGDQRRGKAVFLPFVLPGEKVEARIAEERPGFARAAVEQIVEASPQRIEAGCPFFGRCGGCHYQHTSYEHQLEIKSQILVETLRRTAKLEPAAPVQVHASEPWNYRNRTRLRVRTKPEFMLGYNRFASHEVLAVEKCPISSPLINRAMAAVWELGRAGKVAAEIEEIEFFANSTDEQMLVELSCSQVLWNRANSVAAFASELRAAMVEVMGVSVFVGPAGKPQVMSDVPQQDQQIFGAQQMEYQAAGACYLVGAGSFFQTNRFLTSRLTSLVTDGHIGEAALDLYAGAGLFTLPLSQNFREVTAVEIAPFSFHDLKRNVPSTVKCFRETTEQFLASHRRKPFDYIVVDPPRGGLGERVARMLGEIGAPEITYVSCDPATLARDVKELLIAGYRVQQIHLLDLFPQTFHIETVLHLAR